MNREDTMAVDDRYNRQELISGWNQKKLENSRVVVIGSGNLANYALVSLAALGVGNIEIYDSAKVEGDKEFLLFEAREGEPKAKSLEAMLQKINPTSRIKGINVPLSTPLMAMIGNPDLIIDATNSKKSKQDILKYGKSRGVKVISGSTTMDSAEMYFVNPGDEFGEAALVAYDGEPQGIILSGILGGVITEEVRKALMPLDALDVPVARFDYSLNSIERFAPKEEEYNRKPLQDKKILVVGAGALGNFAVLGAALEGIGNIDVLDFDEVDSTNLNRQILFYDAVGKMKSSALAKKVAEIAPEVNLKGLIGKLDEHCKYFEKNHPDAILDCVDSFAARAVINYYAVRNGIPLISGGTNPRSGQVTVYRPGKSACLDCKLGVETALAKQMTARSCRYAPDPSVIMTNQVIGNMMVGEALKVLDPGCGDAVKRILKYDSTAPKRGGLIGGIESCDCVKPGIKEWLAEVRRKYKEEKK